MSDLTKDRVWEQIETLRAQYALSIAENLEIIKDARAHIAKARKLADELPVLKTRRKKQGEKLDAVVAEQQGTLVLDATAAEILGAHTVPSFHVSEFIRNKDGIVIAQSRGDEFSGEQLNAKLDALAAGATPVNMATLFADPEIQKEYDAAVAEAVRRDDV